MKYFIAILVTSLIASVVALPAEPSDGHVLPREEGRTCGKCVLHGEDLRPKEIRLQTYSPHSKCKTLSLDKQDGVCVNEHCGLCVMFK